MDSWSAIASCMVLRTIVTRPTDQAIRRNVLILQQSGDDTARNLCFIVPFPDGELGIEQRVLLGLFHLVLVEDASLRRVNARNHGHSLGRTYLVLESSFAGLAEALVIVFVDGGEVSFRHDM